MVIRELHVVVIRSTLIGQLGHIRTLSELGALVVVKTMQENKVE